MRRTRKIHRLLGIVLVLPICGWALTAFVFFIKPGYASAYGALSVREYAMDGIPALRPTGDWLETRTFRTILGPALLVRSQTGWRNLDPGTLAPRPLPDESDLRRLVEDATSASRARYGEIRSIARREADPPGATIATANGVRIELDWSDLSMQQSGRDTRLIDGLYKVHYLQWTGVRAVDRVVGAVGLVFLLALAILGIRLAFAKAA
jgi:hypothetical protein